MSAEKLGGAVNDKVGAEFQRLLIDRRGERVIDYDQSTMAMGGGRQASEVDDFVGRVGRTLQIHNLAASGDGGLNRLVIAGIAKGHADLKPWQKFDEKFVRASVGVVHRYQTVAGREQREQRIADRRHAAGEAGCGFGAFQGLYLLLERGYGGIGIAAVNVSGFLALRDLQPFVNILVAKRDAVRHRDLGGAHPVNGLLSCPDRERSLSWCSVGIVVG